MTSSAKYLNTSSRLLDQAYVELEAGDLIQASEKFWSAAAQAMKATAHNRGWAHNSHAHLYEILRRTVDETGDKDLVDLFSDVNLLHVNFYEDILLEDEIRRLSDRVRDFVARLEDINPN